MKQKIKLAQTPEDFEAQAKKFLADNGFPDNQVHLTLYGSMIQHSDASEDELDGNVIAKRMRKQIANELAFFLMYPERRIKQDESEGSTGTAESVAEEA